MKKFILIAALVCFGGCGDFNFDMLSKRTADGAAPVASAASDVVTVIEDVADIEIISDATATKGEAIATQVSQGATAAQAAVKIATPFMGEYADTANAGLLALLALAGGAARFFRKQRNEEKEDKEFAEGIVDKSIDRMQEANENLSEERELVNTLIVAASKVPNSGEAIKKEALENLQADAIEERYLDLKSVGALEKSEKS